MYYNAAVVVVHQKVVGMGPGPNPTSYNATSSLVRFEKNIPLYKNALGSYNNGVVIECTLKLPRSSLVRFENKILSSSSKKTFSLLQRWRCSCMYVIKKS
jgi:hypothetical protein